jgi:hypothetical protein
VKGVGVSALFGDGPANSRANENKACALDGGMSFIIRSSFPPTSRDSPEMDSTNKFSAKKTIQIHQNNDDNKKLPYSVFESF